MGGRNGGRVWSVVNIETEKERKSDLVIIVARLLDDFSVEITDLFHHLLHTSFGERFPFFSLSPSTFEIGPFSKLRYLSSVDLMMLVFES